MNTHLPKKKMPPVWHWSAIDGVLSFRGLDSREYHFFAIALPKDPLWQGVIETINVSSMGKIYLFKNHLHFIRQFVFCLFNGISTFVGYLMAKPFS